MDKKIVESHRDAAYALLIIGVSFGFFALLAAFMIFIVAPQYEIGKQIGLTLTGLGSFAFAIYSLVHYLRDVPKVIISTSRITVKSIFSTKEITFDDIEKIGLKQKTMLRYGGIFSRSMESTIIQTKQSGEIVLWDHYYENINKIKFVLDGIVKKIAQGETNFAELLIQKKRPTVKLIPIDDEIVMNEQFEEISGNRFLTFNSIVFWGFFAFSVSFFFHTKNLTNTIESFLFINGLMYGLMGYQSNYFLISDNYLQVKNHLWFWKKITYRLTDVREVIYEIPGKLSQSTRIVLNNYSADLHSAGSLKDEHWDKLRTDLEKRGVKVRDDSGTW